ncbi:MAG: GWxTD domain-containing protein [Gemmatimonadota bacterium]|nr:GWxTD domain-containing protein [Gemmatimonadota bacterium]
MTRAILTICALLLLSAVSPARGAFEKADTTAIADPILLPANSTGDLDFALDMAGFMGADGKTYMEMYLLLRPSQFTLEEIKKQLYRGKFEIEAVIYDGNDTEVHRIKEERLYETDQPVLVSRRGHEERVSMDMLTMVVNPGTYRADVKIIDKNSKKEGAVSKPFVADLYDDERLMVSDLQFSAQVQQDSTQSHRFSKNGLLVLPNPTRIFEKWAEQPSGETYKPKIMYIYFEMYNLVVATDVETSATYDVTYSVTSHTSSMTYPMPPQKKQAKPGRSGVKLIALDITSFPQDVYTLELSVIDNATGEAFTRQCIFEVIQPPPPPPPVTVLSEDMAKRGEKMLRAMATNGIAMNRDYDLYKRLNLEAKTEFLINFWKERDPTPTTPENEYMIVFNERFSFAEYQLGGAQSDRGGVFLRFGYPEEIERRDSDNNSKSYQIWYYTTGVQGDAGRADGGGRQYFVFGDRKAVGRFELLHSSVTGYANNPDWRRLLLFDPNQLEQVQYGKTQSIKQGEP